MPATITGPSFDGIAQRMTIYLLRHGESEGNRAAVFSGVSDHALTPLGREQARAAGARFAGWDFTAIYTSRLSRAIETANIFVATSGCSFALREARAELNERNFGSFESRPQPPANELVPGEVTWHICNDVDFVPLGGESMRQTHARAVAFLDVARKAGGNVLIVAHGNVLRSMTLHALGWPVEMLPEMPSRNCLVTRLC